METQENLPLWADLLESSPETETDLASKVNYLQTVEGGSPGYRLRRVILCNFWLYGIQEFEIPHGRLFLAGENASGKSSVLAAALPLALDGNINPNRLDTFGTRQRKIDYYVLGSAESSTSYLYERRTTYIALEFEWCDPLNPPFAPDIRQRWLEARSPVERARARWLTIGLSLAGNVNANEKVRPVRFLLTDGSRFGYDVRMIDQKNVAYDQPTFKRLLGENGRGIVCDTVADYQSHVARYLFNINDVRDFQNIIQMLLVIRQPNLGTEINFSRVHDYLKQALPRIPDEITRRVTGTLERIDTIQNQLEHLQEAYEAAAALDKVAQKLAIAGARRASLVYLKARNSENSYQGRVTSLEKEKAAAEADLEIANTQYAELNQETDEVSGQLVALEKSEGLQVAEKIALSRTVAQEAQNRLTAQTTQLANSRQAVVTATARLERLKTGWTNWLSENRRQLQTLVQQARSEVNWELAAGQLEEVARQVAVLNIAAENQLALPGTLDALRGTLIQERIQKLSQLEELHRERESLAVTTRIATERAAERRADYDVVRRQREESQESVANARESLANEWRHLHREENSWLSQFPDYRLAEVVSNVLRAPFEEYQSLAQSVVQEVVRAVHQQDEAYSRLTQETGARQSRLVELEAEYQRKQAEPDRLPLRTARRQAARQLLATQKITAYPLYALLDFRPELTAAQAGQLEQLLEEAGLLDGLVVHFRDNERVGTILAAHNLSDTFIVPLATQPANQSTLANWLLFDPASVSSDIDEWQLIVERILLAFPVVAPGTEFLIWQHGLLAGKVGAIANEAGYVGLANRKRLRQQELTELENRLSQAHQELTSLEKQRQANRVARQRLLEEQSHLEKMSRAEVVTKVEAEYARLELERQRAERFLQEAQNTERESRQNLNAMIARILQESVDIPAAAHDTRRTRSILDATIQLQNELARLAQGLAAGAERRADFIEAAATLESARQSEVLAAQLQAESQALAIRAQAELVELEKITASADWQQLVERVAYLRERSKNLPVELQKAAARRGQVEERLRNLTETLEIALQTLDEARQKRTTTQLTFSLKLAFYPALGLVEARALDEKGDIFKAAQQLLRLPNREGENLPSEEELETDYNRIASQLLTEFNRQRAFLAEYGPELDEESRIIFIAEDQIEPPALLSLLATQIEVQRTLLDKEERILFEDFLLQEMAEAIRTHITGADQWAQAINAVLHNLPMVGERYSLEWKPLEVAEIADGHGNHIARYHRLLSKPIQELSPEESQLILDALRREIASLRLRQKDEPGLNFMEALVQIFDYREWFRFGVFITPHGGQRIRLTDRNAGTRSGAEQLFALYVPLFAALAALYSSRAGKGSPRLLALDEAFDKASLANTQKIMQFLVLQDFQWIMTGPQVSGMGSKVPVSAEYQMLHEKGTSIATAVPFYWIGEQAAN